MRWPTLLPAVIAATLPLTGCATTAFTSTWRNPNAQPLATAGSKVAALVMTKNEAARRAAEDALAREISAHGAQGVPMYTISANTDEKAARAALEQAGFDGVVVMRPLGREQQVTSTPVYGGPYYGGFWGGYYGYGWGAPWGGTEIRTDTIVHVETLVYSLKQNALVWAGQSETTNPSQVDAFVHDLAAATASELRKQGLIAPA
jgi:hypothetical protein